MQDFKELGYEDFFSFVCYFIMMKEYLAHWQYSMRERKYVCILEIKSHLGLIVNKLV